MKIKEIYYLSPPQDLFEDHLDVVVILEDEYCSDDFAYTVEVTTPQYLSYFIEKSGSSFLPPYVPYIIVSKLTDEIIHAAIQSFIDTEDDSYWLKLYHTAATLQIEDLNEILYRKKQEEIELEAKIEKELEEEDKRKLD